MQPLSTVVWLLFLKLFLSCLDHVVSVMCCCPFLTLFSFYMYSYKNAFISIYIHIVVRILTVF